MLEKLLHQNPEGSEDDDSDDDDGSDDGGSGGGGDEDERLPLAARFACDLGSLRGRTLLEQAAANGHTPGVLLLLNSGLFGKPSSSQDAAVVQTGDDDDDDDEEGALLSREACLGALSLASAFGYRAVAEALEGHLGIARVRWGEEEPSAQQLQLQQQKEQEQQQQQQQQKEQEQEQQQEEHQRGEDGGEFLDGEGGSDHQDQGFVGEEGGSELQQSIADMSKLSGGQEGQVELSEQQEGVAESEYEEKQQQNPDSAPLGDQDGKTPDNDADY